MLSFLFLVSNCPNSLTFFFVSPPPIENERGKRDKKEKKGTRVTLLWRSGAGDTLTTPPPPSLPLNCSPVSSPVCFH